jgi:hypothetical protein
LKPLNKQRQTLPLLLPPPLKLLLKPLQHQPKK